MNNNNFANWTDAQLVLAWAMNWTSSKKAFVNWYITTSGTYMNYSHFCSYTNNNEPSPGTYRIAVIFYLNSLTAPNLPNLPMAPIAAVVAPVPVPPVVLPAPASNTTSVDTAGATNNDVEDEKEPADENSEDEAENNGSEHISVSIEDLQNSLQREREFRDQMTNNVISLESDIAELRKQKQDQEEMLKLLVDLMLGNPATLKLIQDRLSKQLKKKE